jgi:hypothetical protein
MPEEEEEEEEEEEDFVYIFLRDQRTDLSRTQFNGANIAFTSDVRMVLC